MKIGVLGTGDVGKHLGDGFIALGHDVMMGSRSATNEKALAWKKTAGAKASVGTFAAAAQFGETIALATLGVATLDILESAGPENFKGKLVLDATNPLDFSGGMPPKLSVGHTDSLGEQIQRAIKDAHVIKCFNTVGSGLMFRPNLPGGPPDMFICGNNADAKRRVAALLKDFGWGTIDSGGIESSRYLEPMCMTWVLHGVMTNSWNHAFKMLHG
ncbi:MAG TPA: NAD(P)-binding domain-containing protein [candidate division Zixibacteria bacterium]|jgi:predicted dinucleotide-binding enzyme